MTLHAPTAKAVARKMHFASPTGCAGLHRIIYFGHPVPIRAGPLPTAPDTALMVSLPPQTTPLRSGLTNALPFVFSALLRSPSKISQSHDTL